MRMPSGALLLGAVAILLVALPATATKLESEVRASFVAKFLRYTTWPASALERAPERFAIGVLSDEAMADSIEEVLSGKSVGGRRVEIRRLSDLSSIDELQMLYIGAIRPQKLVAVIHALEGMPILTVSHAEGFARTGGVIALVTQGKRIRFEINRATVAKAGLTISSRVLNLASHLYGEP